MDTEREEKREILQSLGKLGIGYLKATQLIEKHSYKRVDQVIKRSEDQKRTNPVGYIIRALAEDWTFWSKPEKMIIPTMMERDISPGNMRLLSSISPFRIEIGMPIGKVYPLTQTTKRVMRVDMYR